MRAAARGHGASDRTQQRIAFLEYLRVFAVFSVLIGHKFHASLQNLALNGDPPWRHLSGLPWLLVQGGGVGVLLFFLVSGYIITLVLQRESSLEFFIKRIFRIYPLYISAVLIEWAGLALAGQPLDLVRLWPQLLLIGDFMGTPYALGLVEWTLRVEVSFYLFATLLRLLNLTQWRAGQALPWIYILVCLILSWIGPWPQQPQWTQGYFTLFFPFLLLGSVIYLFQRGSVSLVSLLIFALFVFAMHQWEMLRWQPRWQHAYFAHLATLIFLGCWYFRAHFHGHRPVFFLARLTYAIYLFHNWMFDWLQNFFLYWQVPVLLANALALASLLLICTVLVATIEQPAIRLGRRLGRRFRPG